MWCTVFLIVDLKALAFTLFQLEPSIKGIYMMACFMVLEPCFFQMEANMMESGKMVLQSK